MNDTLLHVCDLEVAVKTPHADLVVVRGVSLRVSSGEVLGLVGESGCGKSMTLRAINGLLPPRTHISDGRILYRGHDLVAAPRSVLDTIRGQEIAMIFQEPMTALNPVMRIGDQIAEGPREENGWSRARARRYAVELMKKVGIPDPVSRLGSYPHELSGGLRQRVMIAIALSREPSLILCDEPTTALDVTVQEQVLRLLLRLREDTGVALVLVTHDLAVIAETCQEVAVMYAGEIVETGSVDAVFRQPNHPYTLCLLRSVPDVDGRRSVLKSIPGTPPDCGMPPDGCRFHPRCPFADESCAQGEFPLRPVGSGRATACRHPERCVHEMAAGWGR